MLKILQDTRSLFGDRSFLQKVVTIALPVTLQGLLNTVVNMIDTLMIGTLGESSIAAVGLANKIFFVFSLLIFGCCSGSGILAAQYWGHGDEANTKRVLGLSLLIGVGGSLVFVVPSLLLPELVMGIFTDSEAAITLGAQYLFLAALSYPFTAVSNIYASMLRAVGQAKLPVFTSVAAILLNTCINYVLIFGKFGAPRWGVAGAAVGTLVARICEMLLLVLAVYWKQLPLAGSFRELFGFKRKLVIQYVQTASPVIINEFLWGLGITMYSLAYGRMGDSAVAAITIAGVLQDLVLVVWQGLSAATAIVLGHSLGAGKPERAQQEARYFFILSGILTVIGMAAVMLFKEEFMSLYSVSAEVARDGALCMVAFVFSMPSRMFNMINVVGVLRSGGDTKACLILDTSTVWFVGVPLAFLGALVWKLPIYWVYGLITLEGVVKMIAGYIRYKQKKWVRNLALEV